MEDLVLASTESDAEAMQRVVEHHAEMDATLGIKADLVATAARTTANEPPVEARKGLVDWFREVMVPHVRAAEATLCREGAKLPEGRLLVEAMVVEHRIIKDLFNQVADSDDRIDTAIVAGSLKQLFGVHLSKVNDQLLPLLVGAPGVQLAELVEELHARANEYAAAAGSAPVDDGYGHPVHDHDQCACGERDVSGHPELDARAVPHAIRHATVFGALEAVRPGKALVLVAPHDPIPLLRQLEGREPGVFSVDYLERGPEAWRLLLTRTAP